MKRASLAWIFQLSVAAVLSVSAASAQTAATDTVRAVTAQELKAILERGEDFQLVDTRVPGEFAAQHLIGARNVPFYELGRARLSKKRPVILYCSSSQCNLSADAAKTLIKQGWPNVRFLEGGWRPRCWPACNGRARTARRRRPLP